MTIVATSIISALLFFAIQLILCFKAKKIQVKLIPVYINMVFILLMAADFAGLFGYNGVISTQGILAMVFAIISCSAIIGEISAWIIYWLQMKKRSR